MSTTTEDKVDKGKTVSSPRVAKLFKPDQTRAWLRASKNLDPDGKILQETIKRNEKIQKKYNELVAKAELDKVEDKKNRVLYNTLHIIKAIEVDEKALKDKEDQEEKKRLDLLSKQKKIFHRILSRRDNCPNPFFQTPSHHNEGYQVPMNNSNNNVIRSLPPGFNPSHQPPVSRHGNGIHIIQDRVDNPLEAEAIMQYKPGLDSKHDMIFGNVMGINYGGFTHGMLWPQNSSVPHQQHQLQQKFQQCDHNEWYNMGPRHSNSAQGYGYHCGGGLPCNNNHNVLPPLRHHHWQDVCDNNHQIQHHIPPRHTQDPHVQLIVGSQGHHQQHNFQHHHCHIRKGLAELKSKSRPQSPRGIWGDVGRHTLLKTALRCGAIVDSMSHPGLDNPRGAVGFLEPTMEVLHRRPLMPTGSSESLLEETKQQMIDVKRRGKPLGLGFCQDLEFNCLTPQILRLQAPRFGPPQGPCVSSRLRRTISLSNVRYITGNNISGL